MSFPSLTTSWPSGAAGRATPWAFAREIDVAGSVPGDKDHDSHPGGKVLQWLQRRNCSITPRQLVAFYASMCVVSLAISAFFMAQGAPFVLFFAGLELTVLGVALLMFARHAGDREILTLTGRSLNIEQRCGSRVARTDFTAEWLTVEPAAGQGSLVQLSGEGRTVQVGRFLRPELRPAFARELRRALRLVPAAAHTAPTADLS